IVALKMKGERAQEVAGFVQSMRRHAIKVSVNDPHAVDGCGTGGDGSDSFNISTAASIVACAAGVTVAKHGNRSVSSKCGSADLLEACKGNIDPGPEVVKKNIDEIGFGFMFAPRFHPAMKHAMAPRKELGVRTVFNILGPMTNPASVKRQVIGVYDRKLLPLVADVMEMTGSTHVVVAHSHDGMDEFSVSAPTDYMEVKDGSRRQKTFHPEDAAITTYGAKSLVGGDAERNVVILRKTLDGDRSPYTDAIILNAGAMIYVAGRAGSIREGSQIARKAIETGAAKSKLEEWIKASNS
ncbi:MAG: anthranilate phosphoribosyltransferase, partial [Candidatus Zixiibacteriota bacterium]